MKKYKISESNLNEFWGWFGKKKPQTLQQVIDKDPVLKKIDAEIQDIFGSSKPFLLKMKKEDPEVWDLLVKGGMVPKDLK
jgi:hypothetical protein